MNLLKLAAEYGTPEWDQEWQDAKHNVKMQEKHVKKVPKEMAEDMAGYGGMAGMALGAAPGIPAAVRAVQTFRGRGQMQPGDIEKMVQSSMGTMHGAIGGSLLGAAGGYLYGKNKVKPEEERLRRYQDQYMNLESQIPAMEDIPAPQEKQAAMDPEEQALYDQYDQAEDQLFDLRRSIPRDIHNQQNMARGEETVMGSLKGGAIGAGIGGALGAARGLIPRLSPAIGRTALAGSVPGALVGNLVGQAKGNERANQILLDKNPELHGQIQGAVQGVNNAEDALYNYMFPQKEAEAYLTGLQKLAAPVTEEEINQLGTQLNETTDQINQGYLSSGRKGGIVGGLAGAAGGLALNRGLRSGRGPQMFTGGGVVGALSGVGIGQSRFERRNKDLIDSREALNDELFDKLVAYNEQPGEEGMG